MLTLDQIGTCAEPPAEIPGWNRIPIAPQTAPLCPSLVLGASVGHPVLRGLLTLVALEVPGQAGLDLIEARVRPIHEHLAEDALVPVSLVENYRDGVSVGQIREVPLRYLTERLALLRRVDACQPYAVSLTLGGQDREGVAVGDADDPASQLIAPSRADRQGEPQGGEHSKKRSCHVGIFALARTNTKSPQFRDYRPRALCHP
jgi:hypothetical protein